MSSFRALRGSVLVGLAVVAVACTAVGAMAFPKPSRVPTRWELTFEPGPLRLYVDQGGTRGAYWYFTYKVTNLTGQDRFWAPRSTLFTDSGDIIDSGAGVPPEVETALLELLGNEYLERQNQVIGKIFVGHANAIEGLVVWPANSLDVTELSLFISGISGETAEVANPASGERLVLQKTLHRNYVIPGNPLARGDDPLELVGEDWVMR